MGAPAPSRLRLIPPPSVIARVSLLGGPLDELAAFSGEDLGAMRDALPVRSGALCARCFDWSMQKWLHHHRRTADESAASESRRERVDRRKQIHAKLKQLVKALKDADALLHGLAKSDDGDDLLLELIVPHVHLLQRPKRVLLGGLPEELDRGLAKLDKLRGGMEQLRKAAERTRAQPDILARRAAPSKRSQGGRPAERGLQAALLDLGWIYLAATGKRPTGTNKENGEHVGGWPDFAREVVRRAGLKQGNLTGHLQEVEKQIKKDREQLIRPSRGRFSHFASSPWFVPYHRRPAPKTEGGA